MRDSISLPAKLIKGAMNYQAKTDVRYYLNGVFISQKGFIAATDGQQLFNAECEDAKQLKEDLIVAIQGKVPAKAWKANLVFFGDNDGYIWYQSSGEKTLKKNNTKECNFFSVIDGKFPDIGKVMPKGKTKAVDTIAVNPSHMATVSKTLKDMGAVYPIVEFKLRGVSDAIEVLLKTPEYNATVLIMPARM